MEDFSLMNGEKAYKIFAVLAILVAIMSFTIGKFILAFLLLVIGLAVFFTSGKGTYNEKNLYDKKVPHQGKSLEELYTFLKDVETPLGEFWMGKFKGVESIILGPSAFKDIIVIQLQKNDFVLKNSNVVDYIEAEGEHELRLEKVLDTSSMEVTPKRYSIFAAFKVMSAVMTDDLAKLIDDFVNGVRTEAPSSLDMFEFYRHNSLEDQLLDMDDNLILDVESDKYPLKVIIKDEEGEEYARVICRNPSFNDATKEIFDIYSDGEVFGTITHDNKSKKNTFIVDTVNGRFEVNSFMAVRKANVSSNFEITKDGVRKAIIIGSAKLNFEGQGGWMQNNVICSFDDEYLVLYIALQLFFMNTSGWLR